MEHSETEEGEIVLEDQDELYNDLYDDVHVTPSNDDDNDNDRKKIPSVTSRIIKSSPKDQTSSNHNPIKNNDTQSNQSMKRSLVLDTSTTRMTKDDDDDSDRLQRKKKKQQYPVRSLTEEVERLEKKCSAIENENTVLKRNIGTLYRTAMAELSRKDALIQSLRNELDELQRKS